MSFQRLCQPKSWAEEIEAVLTLLYMCTYMTHSFDKFNIMVPKTTRDAAKGGGETGIAKSQHRMTADSREGDKNYSESSVTQNCSFQGLIVFKNPYAMRKGLSAQSPSLSRSSHQLSTHLSVRQRMS